MVLRRMVPKTKPKFVEIGVRNYFLAPGNPSGKVGGLRPPPFLMGFWTQKAISTPKVDEYLF
jgi:hypothetical protein